MALPHIGDPIKELEHLAMDALFTQRPPTNQIIASGPWSSSSIWSRGQVPTAGEDVCIGAGFKVDVDAVFGDPLRTLCVDGGAWLNFLPDRNTGLCAATTCICTDATTGAVGKLTIGDVGAPIQPGFTATWTIADRGLRDDAMRAYDPLDLSGCLMSHGTLRMFGSPKVPYASPSVRPTGNTVTFDALPQGWAVGDFLIFPVDYFQVDGQEELRQIVGISGSQITLDSPLLLPHTITQFNIDSTHQPYILPVANLTRNIVIHSANPDDITRRGHVMQMHRQDAQVSFVQFKDLGRTDSARLHTVPQLTSFDPTTGAMGTLIPGTDSNPAGRYPWHAHVRSGVTYAATKPITTDGCVTWGSPKHGMVHHGAYAYFSRNIVYRCHGSGLFGENGSEIGAWRKNYACACLTNPLDGAGDTRIAAWPVPDDAGHLGTGFWFTPGIELTDNMAFGCSFGALSSATPLMFDMRLDPVDHERLSDANMGWFEPANINPPAGLVGPDGSTFERPAQAGIVYWASDPTKVDTHSMAGYAARSTFIGCQIGLKAYQVMGTGATFSIYAHRCWLGWDMSYATNITLQDSVITGCDMSAPRVEELASGSALNGNSVSMNITIKNSRIQGYGAGIKLTGDFKQQSVKEISNCHFQNSIDILIDLPYWETLKIDNPTFDPWPSNALVHKECNIKLTNDIRSVPSDLWKPCRILVNGKDVLHNCRLPGAVVFPFVPPLGGQYNNAWTGLTGQQIEDQFGIRPGGYEVADQAFLIDPAISVIGGGFGTVGALIGPAPLPPAAPVAQFSASPMSGTAPLIVQFTDQSTNAPTSWAWNFGDGSMSTMQNPSHQYASAGTYTVSLTATNAGGSNMATKVSLISVTVPQVAVPDVATAFNAAIAAAASQAASSLAAAGLTAAVAAPHITQTPAAGTMVPVGSSVSVG